VLEHFAAPEGGFYDTGDQHEALIVRPRSLQDNAVPSGNSMIAKGLARLAAYTGEARYEDSARKLLSMLAEAMRQYPQAFGEALSAADMLVSGLSEVAVIGVPSAAKSLLDAVQKPYHPNAIIALAPADVPGEAAIPLLSYRTTRHDKPTVYVCRHFVCANPVNTPEAIMSLLAS
jgi:uncharacterized protein YyaL (SSP411 family)